MPARRAVLPPTDRALLRRRGVLSPPEAAASIGATARQLRRWRQEPPREGLPFIRLSSKSVVHAVRLVRVAPLPTTQRR
jgi:hypothetical protein